MRRHEWDHEEGFTLIELMVVVLIIGILIAIALPTYLGARQRAADRAAQTDLRTGLVAALTYYVSTGTYTTFTDVVAETNETALNWVYHVQPVVKQVSIAENAGDQLVLVARSGSQTFFCIAQLGASPGTDKGMDGLFTNVDTLAECTGGW